MRRYNIVRALVFAMLIGGVGLAFALSTGPEPARTGAFKVQNKGAEINCTLCHTANAQGIPPGINDPSGRLRILDVPANYVPGNTYTLRVHLEHDWNPMPPDPLRWGFQLQAVQASTGDSAGTWIMVPNSPPDTFKVMKTSTLSVYKNRRYIEHTRNPSLPDAPGGATHLGELGPIEWHVNWKAPPGDSGKIYFFAAGNSANGDATSTDSGDFIFTTAESTIGRSNVDVPAHPAPLGLRSGLDPPYPNPMVKCTGVSFTIAKGGLVDISVYDLQGRKVRTALHEFREAGTHGAYWDGRGDDRQFVKNGVYLIRLSAPDGKRSSQKLVLAR
ncbi:MAG: T9SS type A sorting domain-containing protein [Candidatus Eisenbacteria bacterium]|uniref:T9SS type A sorting domain-containing protein n=1 Tax=Eiseniibacteriota bacterium TaxID=2212470 RepID=A0A538SQ87_UNCEI|nr:MAG: T9SS type A sorting domain-containing protein [Candidatus Eisenbacteria bacterium]